MNSKAAYLMLGGVKCVWVNSAVLTVKAIDVNPKTWEYLRGSLALIPRPIKVSAGRGIRSFYPESVISLITKIQSEYRSGKSYPTIALELRSEANKVIAETEEIRRRYEVEKSVKRELGLNLSLSQHPNVVIKDQITEQVSLVEHKTSEIKKDLRQEFKRLDGKSLNALSRIKSCIEELASLEVRKRVLETLNLSFAR